MVNVAAFQKDMILFIYKKIFLPTFWNNVHEIDYGGVP